MSDPKGASPSQPSPDFQPGWLDRDIQRASKRVEEWNRPAPAVAEDTQPKSILSQIELAVARVNVANVIIPPAPAVAEDVGKAPTGLMTQCPPDSALMLAWKAYQETDAFKDGLYWATTETIMRKERAQELGIDPEQNRADFAKREQYAKGSMWAAFVVGFEAAALTRPASDTAAHSDLRALPLAELQAIKEKADTSIKTIAELRAVADGMAETLHHIVAVAIEGFSGERDESEALSEINNTGRKTLAAYEAMKDKTI